MEDNGWTEILESLAELENEQLQGLLDSSKFGFDGNFTITADELVYSGLCQYYPLIETVIQDKTGMHLRLNLEKSVPMGTESTSFRVEIAAANVTDAILKPDSIAAVPSYLLRFVPYVGSSAVLIATALRQAFYRASREHGADQLYPRQNDTVTIDVQSLLKTLGNVISRAKFFRIFQQGDMDWFVQRAEPKHRISEGHIRREPNTYHYRGLVLTPGDAQDLYDWLLAHGLPLDPLAVLAKAITTPRDQILVFPYRLPDEKAVALFTEPASVHQVVTRALAPKSLDPTLAGLCDQLASHLIRPESFLAVPWYWFQRVLPELGDDLGVLYLMCKNCCYVDWARGKDRNTFWVPGGLPTLQGWIRSETLPKRIPHATPSKRGRPKSTEVSPDSAYTRQWRQSNRDLASQYLCRLDTRSSETGTDWHLQVSEVQLTAADESLKQALYAFLFAPPDPVSPELLSAYASSEHWQRAMLSNSEANPDRLCHFETLVGAGICQNETFTPEEICHFDTLVDGLNYYFETLIEAGICQFDTIIKILSRLKYTPFFNQETVPAKIAAPVDGSDSEMVVRSSDVLENDWDYSKLMSGINPELRKRIQKLGFEKSFLTWLIAGSLNPQIHSPVSFAIATALENQQSPAGPAAGLADLQAGDLCRLLKKTMRRMEQNYLGPAINSGIGSEDLQSLLQPVADNPGRLKLLRRLADALGLED
jgi:hypothetical protein